MSESSTPVQPENYVTFQQLEHEWLCRAIRTRDIELYERVLKARQVRLECVEAYNRLQDEDPDNCSEMQAVRISQLERALAEAKKGNEASL